MNKRDILHERKHSSGALNSVHDYGIDLDTAEIFLFGREESNYGYGEPMPEEPGVDYMLSNQFVRNIRTLQTHTNKPILVHMKTCGGIWGEGMAIYDAIKACPNFVAILNYTHARSMSSLILQAADFRAMMPHSTFMFHEGTFGFEGTQKQLRTEYAESQRSMDRMLEIYAEQMKVASRFKDWSDAGLKNWLRKQMDTREEVYLTAKEAVHHGFADIVFGEEGNYNWDLLREGGYEFF